MEKPQEHSDNRVQISKSVFDGLEFIRRSGATNMLDRPVVLQLAREWDLTETADWIDHADTQTYARLIFQGPEVVGEETLDEKLDRMDREYDEERRGFWEGTEPSPATTVEDVPAPRSATPERMPMCSTLVQLGHLAALTLADTYDTEAIGVLFGVSLDRINAERTILLRNLVEAANLGAQLEETVTAIERGIELLQNLIDPENN
ncbi:MAG: DUF5049 domain-containing protein [Thermomicrobiales bacterium]